MNEPGVRCKICKKLFKTPHALEQHSADAHAEKQKVEAPKLQLQVAKPPHMQMVLAKHPLKKVEVKSLKQKDMISPRQRQLFRAEQQEAVRTLYRAGARSVTSEADEGDDECDGNLALEYHVPPPSKDIVERSSDSPVITEDDILYILRISGAIDAGRIARKLRERGFKGATKKDINPILYNSLQKKGLADIDHQENATPMWKAMDAERTSYDELLDFSRQVGASFFVCLRPKKNGEDGYRVCCTLIWEHDEISETTTSIRLFEAEARKFAAHEMLKLLRKHYPREEARLIRLWNVAFERGLELQRGGNYVSRMETALVEWKGGPVENQIWPLEALWSSLTNNAVKYMCAMWNTMTLYPSLGTESEIAFGVHDDSGTVQGVAIACDQLQTPEKTKTWLLTKVQDRISDLWKDVFLQAIDGKILPSDYYNVDLQQARPGNVDGDGSFFHFIVRIQQRHIPTLQAAHFKGDLWKRNAKNYKAELIKFEPEDFGRVFGGKK